MCISFFCGKGEEKNAGANNKFNKLQVLYLVITKNEKVQYNKGKWYSTKYNIIPSSKSPPERGAKL